MSISGLFDNISEADYMDTGSTYTDDYLYPKTQKIVRYEAASKFSITNYKEKVFIKFDGEPERRVRAKLMRDGFRWISSKHKWYKKCVIDKEQTIDSITRYLEDRTMLKKQTKEV